MKTRFQILCAALALSTAAQAQNIDLSLNPLGLLFGRPNVTAEYGVTEAIGVELSLDPTFRNLKLDGTKYKARGIGAGLAGKFYFGTDDGNDRFYGMLYSRFSNVKNTTESANSGSSDFTRFKVGLGVGAGYKWVANNNLVFEIALGAGKNLVNKFTYDGQGGDDEFDDTLQALTSIDGYGRLSIGYRISQ